jgi:tRNA threonylcarbamoyladenosine biosynthesis protein TsaB
MALILSLETSASTCSVAIHENGNLLANLEIATPQAHASQLAVLIERVFHEASLDIQQLNAVSVSSGPGSYTGVRIGTSTAKGICFALNIHLIAIPTLDLLVSQAAEYSGRAELLCPMIDAKRMEVYCQIVRPDFQVVSEPKAIIIDETSFVELLETNRILFFGDGSKKCKSVLTHQNALFIDDILPSAEKMGLISFVKFQHRKFEDLVNFTPFYLKDFIAKKAPAPF